MEGAGSGALEGVILGMEAAGEAARGGGRCGPALALIVLTVTVPPASLICAIAGAESGESKAVLEKTEQELRAAISEIDLQKLLTEQISLAARNKAQRELILLSSEKISPTAGSATLARSPNSEVDTLLEVVIKNSGLCAYGRVAKSTPLAAFVQVTARFVRRRDGAQLYSQTWSHTAGALPFAAWAENHGAALREGLTGIPPTLAQDIVEELFLLYDPRP
jgi:hypothetical protein